MERGFKLDDRQKVEFEVIEKVELPKIEISKIERLQYILSDLYKNAKFNIKFGIKIYQIKRLIKMKEPILEQLKHKPLWLKIIGIILMILGFFGVNTDIISQQLDQIATVFVGIITLISGFMVSKKEVEPEK